MRTKPRYYLITWNGYLKYVKTTTDYCEVIQQDHNGKLISWDLPTEYRYTGEEDIKEITAQEYNKVKSKL